MHPTQNMIRIYFDNRPLFIASEKSEALEGYLQQPGSILSTQVDTRSIREMIASMQNEKTLAGVILCENIDDAMQAIRNDTKLVVAAGGFIYSDSKEVLLIFRKKKWDMPKGKIDKGETLEACAIREIREETGLKSLELERHLATSYHTYPEKGRLVLKESHWFQIRGNQNDVLLPQTEEEIEKCEWVRFDALTPYLDNAHAAIVDVVKKGLTAVQN